MYQGYLQLGGVEILNAARATAYVNKFLPRLDVMCDSDGLQASLGHSPYVSPATDHAPWYKSTRPQSARFYGLFPGKIEGLEDSTRSTPVTELSGDGAVYSLPRYGAKEFRVVALALAADAEALADGMTWLRDVLGANCGEGIGCTGREAKLFTALPPTRIAASSMWRSFFRAEVIDGPKVTDEFPGGVACRVEFTISAGIPWAFTPAAQTGSIIPSDGSSWTDPAGEDCGLEASAYNDFINDPFFTAISRPPLPAVVKPPNILKISSWRRQSLDIPENTSGRWGRVIPSVHVSTVSAIQQLRIRFYLTGSALAGCGFDGEFLVSYVPPNAVLTIDGRSREVSVLLPDGRTVPGAHLLYGSDGLPFTWPSLACHNKYTMVADLMPGQSGAVVMLDTSVRE